MKRLEWTVWKLKVKQERNTKEDLKNILIWINFNWSLSLFWFCLNNFFQLLQLILQEICGIINFVYVFDPLKRDGFGRHNLSNAMSNIP